MKLVCPPFKGENKGHYSAGVISKGMLYDDSNYYFHLSLF